MRGRRSILAADQFTVLGGLAAALRRDAFRSFFLSFFLSGPIRSYAAAR